MVLVDLGVEGGEKANYWTCDFSHVSKGESVEAKREWDVWV